jgi:hypothetical protein
MDQVGTELPQCRDNARLWRSKADVGIEGKRNAAQWDDPRASVTFRRFLRCEEQRLVAFALGIFQQAAECCDDAVDIGKECLRD